MCILCHHTVLARVSINFSRHVCRPLNLHKAVDAKRVQCHPNYGFTAYARGIKQHLCPLGKHCHL